MRLRTSSSRVLLLPFAVAGLVLSLLTVPAGASGEPVEPPAASGGEAEAVGSPRPAAAGPQPAAEATGCGYATTGRFADSICWLDMARYDDATARTAGGQQMTASLPAGYTISYTITTRPVVRAGRMRRPG